MPSSTRILLLDRIKHDWIEGVLLPSFYGDPPLALRWQAAEGTETVPRTFTGSLEAEGWLALFARLGPTVLLLGELGAGKTTTMLLALRELERRSRANHQLPLPLFVSLSAWKFSDDDFAQWLQQFVSRHYHFPPSSTVEWLENSALWLFVDDFDQLPSPLQASCVTALNRFRREHPAIALVISATAEPAKLTVDGILNLLPLSTSQIQGRLGAHNRELALSLRSPSSLYAILQRPLLLQAALSAFPENLPADWNQVAAPEQGTGFIWEHYLRHAYPETEAAQKKRQYLGWLAHTLQRQGRTAFYLDDLQPAWLGSQKLIEKYAVQSRGLVGGLATLVWGGAFPLNLVGFWIIGRTLSRSPKQRPWPAIWLAYLLIGLFEALLTALLLFVMWSSLELLLSFITLDLTADSSELLLISGLFIAGNSALHLFLYRLTPGHHLDLHQDIERQDLVWSTALAFRGLPRGLLHGVLAGLFVGAAVAVMLATLYTATTGFLAGFGFFLIVLSWYLALSFLKEGWKSGLDARTVSRPGAVWQMAKRRVLTAMGVAGVLNLLLLSPAVGLGLGLTLLAPGGWLAALLAAVLGTLLFIFLNTLPFTLMAALYYGGQTWLKRVVLLRLLVKSGALPQDPITFLEDAADRSLLKIAGGRIMFYHQELQEYLVSTHPGH